ncbi:FMN-dependent NADH-azoreductase [Rodentibacter caecimuris]|uniref:FMN-dependent NADH-azoreductase n=1 Tax=Rodentibacter caecimuris TaxID=1796644 RepID=UPI000985A20B|nr:hypothetical protein BKG97_08000 [Rodentibacter heylii]
MKTLLINAPPQFHLLNYTRKLQNYFVEQWAKLNPNEQITIISLAETDVPRLDDETLTLFSQKMAGAELTLAQQERAVKMQEILTQFKSHKRIVIAMPLHNFNIPSKLKDYMDNIFIAHETFRYTASGSEGLMIDGRKVFLLQSSGSIYTNNDRYTPLEFSRMYLKKMFINMMGFDAFYIARAQGTAIRSEDDVLTEAFAEIDRLLADFCQ